MAFKTVDGKEIRVPGRAIPLEKRRQGALGKLDGMTYTEFKEMNKYSSEDLLREARRDKGDEKRVEGAKQKMAEYGLDIKVRVGERSHYPGGGCGMEYYSQLILTVEKEGFEPLKDLQEYQYRSAYSAAKDDYSNHLRWAEILDVELQGDRLTVLVKAIACRFWTKEVTFSLKLKEKTKQEQSEAKLREIAVISSVNVLGKIKERQAQALRTGVPLDIYAHSYDEPRVIDTEFDASRQYAVFVVEEMIDHRVDSGKQFRWTAYKVGMDGEAIEVWSDHSYEREESGKIAISGCTSDGIVLICRGGAKKVV